MIKRFHTNHRMSQAVSYDLSGRVVVLAGQVAADAQATLEVQTQQVLAKIDALLAEAGASKDDVVSASIWLASIADFHGMNAVWDKWVSPGHGPARATVESKLANPLLKVESQVTAVVAA